MMASKTEHKRSNRLRASGSEGMRPMNGRRKTLTILVSVAMLLSMLPTNALAEMVGIDGGSAEVVETPTSVIDESGVEAPGADEAPAAGDTDVESEVAQEIAASDGESLVAEAATEDEAAAEGTVADEPRDDATSNDYAEAEPVAGSEAYLSGTLSVEGLDYAVSVDPTEDAKLPANAQLVVSEVSGAAYDEYVAQAESALGKGALSIGRIFDIGFEVEGESVEPASEVSVHIRLANAEEEAAKVLHITDEGVEEIIEYVKSFDFNCNSASKYFELSGKFTGLANRRKDYSNIRHKINGELVSHDKVHNLFGYMMTRAASEGFKRLAPEKNILIFSRSSYIGMHRYGGIWTGDNQSWWSHILLNIKMMPSLNMCGFIYTGADLGGFGANCTRDLLLRWLAVGIFTPLMRDHSALGTRRQECYSMGDTKAFKGIIELRYRLLPYLYESYLNACNNDDMMIKPLAFGYPDDRRARHIEDQLLVGDSIMIAPIYEQNAVGRCVYLPEEMRLVIFKDANVYRSEVLSQGTHYIEAALDEVPVFIRKGKKLPLCAPAQCTAGLSEEITEIIQ